MLLYLFFHLSLLSDQSWDSFASAVEEPACAYSLVPSTAICGCLFPRVHADLGRLQVAFANVRASCRSGSCGKLPIQDVFGDAAMLYAMNVTKPAQASLCEEGIHAWHVGLLQNVLVGHMVLPRDAKDPSQAP